MRRAILLLTALSLLLIPALASAAEPADEAARHFVDGERLLMKADFSGAIAAFTAAVETDAENQRYRDELALLRRVVALRPLVLTQNDPEKWERTAKSLRSYYYDHGIFTEALEIDRMRFEREGSAETAAMLAETQLELKKNIEALELLSTIDADAQTPRTRRLRAIALARELRTDEAVSIAQRLPDPEEKDAQAHLELARLYALLGDEPAMSKHLAAAFTWTAPSRLDALRKTVASHADFSGFAATETFAATLKTPSKVVESSCSSGASCGSCPSRTTCGSGEDTSKDKK